MFAYSLESGDYSVKNALLWGNFAGHAEKARASGRLQDRIIHCLIAALELLPVIGQIASLFEYAIVTKFSEVRLNDRVIRQLPMPYVWQDESRNINTVAALLRQMDLHRPEYVSFTNSAYDKAYGRGDGVSAWKIHISIEPEKRDAAWQIFLKACDKTSLKVHGKVHSCTAADNTLLQPGKEFTLLVDSQDERGYKWGLFLSELAYEFQKAGILPDPRLFNSLDEQGRDRIIPTHDFPAYFAYRSDHTPINLRDPIAVFVEISKRNIALAMMSNKQWAELRNFIQENPAVLRMVGAGALPTLLYNVRGCDTSPECQEVIRMIMDGSDWTIGDKEFGNTPFLVAIASREPSVIALYFDYVAEHAELHAMYTQANTDTRYASTTPLLMAIKNGDQDTACRLIDKYAACDLQHYEKQGHTALHLACYLKLNRVVRSIMERAKALGCVQGLLAQKSSLGFTAAELYRAPWSEQEPHGHINDYWYAVGEHMFSHERDSDTVNEGIMSLFCVGV